MTVQLIRIILEDVPQESFWPNVAILLCCVPCRANDSLITLVKKVIQNPLALAVDLFLVRTRICLKNLKKIR